MKGGSREVKGNKGTGGGKNVVREAEDSDLPVPPPPHKQRKTAMF